jgi:uncharacterized protein
MSSSTEVRRNDEQSRYEIILDGTLAGIADYYERGDALVFPHTEIDHRHRGKGLGAILVRGALDDVAQSGKAVVPSCWYVAQFIDENPQYRPLLAA